MITQERNHRQRLMNMGLSLKIIATEFSPIFIFITRKRYRKIPKRTKIVVKIR
jgi:hypothetical protein